MSMTVKSLSDKTAKGHGLEILEAEFLLNEIDRLAGMEAKLREAEKRAKDAETYAVNANFVSHANLRDCKAKLHAAESSKAALEKALFDLRYAVLCNHAPEGEGSMEDYLKVAYDKAGAALSQKENGNG